MAQKVLFPGTHMRITQGEYGVTSHKGSLARDDGGESTAFDSPVLAPFDGYFARVRTDSSHETYFVSDEPVECANGYVGTVSYTHLCLRQIPCHMGFQQILQWFRLTHQERFCGMCLYLSLIHI